MGTPWLDEEQPAAWMKLQALVELLPGVLENQLRRDCGLTHFEYLVLAMLSEAPGRLLRMSDLARRTNASLPRLSHVIKRLEARDLVARVPCDQDARATNAHLTQAGWQLLKAAAPGHVRQVRESVIDALSPEQIEQLDGISEAILQRIDPDRVVYPIS